MKHGWFQPACRFGRGEEEEDGGLGNLVGGLLMIFLAPIAATILQLAISRWRENEADATGARLRPARPPQTLVQPVWRRPTA